MAAFTLSPCAVFGPSEPVSLATAAETPKAPDTQTTPFREPPRVLPCSVRTEPSTGSGLKARLCLVEAWLSHALHFDRLSANGVGVRLGEAVG